MIKVPVTGAAGNKLFEVDIDETMFTAFQRAYWSYPQGRIVVECTNPYAPSNPKFLYTAFGWCREQFKECCGMQQVTQFHSMAYNPTTLHDSHTPTVDAVISRSKPYWEKWYELAVRPDTQPAIGIIPDTIQKDGTITTRNEFYEFLKTKGQLMFQAKNSIYHNSLLNVYMFVHPQSKTLSKTYGPARDEPKYI